jgi:RNA polymerase sigma factor (sigma-70 family)
MSRPSHLRIVKTAPDEASEPSDDALMALAAGGRAHAFDTLVARHEQRVRRFCGLLTNDEVLARDLSQEVFLKLWATRERYRPEGRLREMLFTFARNLVRSHQRKQALRSVLGLRFGHPEEPATSGDPHEDSERAMLVNRALQQLPEKFRTPLALRFVDDLAYEEIARVIGRTESAARSRVFYGLKALAALLPPEVQP